MTTEFWLFIIVGTIAVVAAVMMLLSENAVHSALFLILNMGCIAFFFLMLNAPFLAMVQITVYAGAIMVLFLFVIMLLGAEKLGGSTPFRWLTPAAMLLALLFLGSAAVVLTQGGVGDLTAPVGNPRVRLAHFVTDAGPVDMRVGDDAVASGLSFGDSSSYLTFAPGEYEVALVAAGTDNVLAQQTVTLDAGLVGTAIAYGAEQPVISLVADNLAATERGSGRLTFFNAFGDVSAVSLVDFGSDFDDNDTQVLIGDVAVGALAGPLAVSEDIDRRTWAFIEAGNERNVLARLGTSEVYDIEAGEAALLILSADRRLEDITRALPTILIAATAPVFGSPTDVGQVLFSRYMLPMQMVAVLLLVAMVGAIVLTHRPKTSPALTRARLGRRRVSRPLTSVIAAQVGHDVTQPGNGAGEPLLEETAGDQES